ncbi:hypothetical protein GCM10022240_03990 [Microbacterium kribbense]|uniref:Uncharacterized protein n=1 Tax=Microbacterium kribbense TaxID=433645 RepID=A0ABP7G281_9MICO
MAPSTKQPAQKPAVKSPAIPGGTDTGCRAYGDKGTSIDSKGRRYTKIDCTTKLPIG